MQKSNRVKLNIVRLHLWNLNPVRFCFCQNVLCEWRLNLVPRLLDGLFHHSLASEFLELSLHLVLHFPLEILL